MKDALIALHYQNDICHARGRIPFSLKRDAASARDFLEASRRALAAARHSGWTIAHMHIAFAADYSDLPRNCRLFQRTEALGALKRGTWGAQALAGFEPGKEDIFVTGTGNSAFRRTALEAELRRCAVERINVIGLATQFSVEHTVRDAADLGFVVRILADCCASADARAHRASLRTMTALADVVESDALFAAAAPKRATPGRPLGDGLER
jgi:biuret amidohydrolase